MLDEKAGKVKLDFGVGPAGGDGRKYFGQVTSVTRRFSIVDWDPTTGWAYKNQNQKHVAMGVIYRSAQSAILFLTRLGSVALRPSFGGLSQRYKVCSR